MHNGYSSKPVDELIQASQQYGGSQSHTSKDFRRLQQLVADDVPIIPLCSCREYVLSTNDITGGQYLSDGTGVPALGALSWI